MATLSVVIPVTREHESKNCLCSLQSQNLEGHSLEIIVVCSNPDYYKDLSFFSSLTVIECENKSAANRRNLGVVESTGDFLAFLDDDTVAKPDWAANMITDLSENEKAVVSGPNYDSRTEFRYRLANELQSHPLAEGLISHRKMSINVRKCRYNSVILANMGVRRELFAEIGGFNERADHYMDDTEFSYIAHKLGYKFLFFRNLSVHHNVRPVFWPFFRRQFHARFHAGMNCVVYPECYVNAPQVKIYALSAILFILMIFLGKPLYWLMFCALYACMVFAIGLSYVKEPVFMLCMPFCIALVHVNGYVSFALGIVYGLYARYTVFKDAVGLKKIRYGIFSKSGRGQ